jgi:hypothetical protein
MASSRWRGRLFGFFRFLWFSAPIVTVASLAHRRLPVVLDSSSLDARIASRTVSQHTPSYANPGDRPVDRAPGIA